MFDTIKCVSFGLGSNFNSAVMQPIKNWHVKPSGGLWGCPIDSEHSWKCFVEEEGLSTKSLKTSFTWTFKGKLLVVQDYEEWEELLSKYPQIDKPHFPNWEAVSQDYDGAFIFYEVPDFDCDSVLVFKSECVII